MNLFIKIINIEMIPLLNTLPDRTFIKIIEASIQQVEKYAQKLIRDMLALYWRIRRSSRLVKSRTNQKGKYINYLYLNKLGVAKGLEVADWLMDYGDSLNQ